MIKLTDKDIKTITVAIFYTPYQEARKKLNMLQTWEIQKKATSQTPRTENYTPQDLKIKWMRLMADQTFQKKRIVNLKIQQQKMIPNEVWREKKKMTKE